MRLTPELSLSDNYERLNDLYNQELAARLTQRRLKAQGY